MNDVCLWFGYVLRSVRRPQTVSILACLLFFLSTLNIVAQVLVTTQHNDNYRTGQNTQETILTPSLLNAQEFGKIFSYPLDGYVYGQPLYVPNVSIPGQGTYNVVYVVTEHDSVYAFDADDNTINGGSPFWHASFINPQGGITTVSPQDVNCPDGVIPEIGITSTPVIDISTNTIYVVVETKENGSFFQRLHVLDITTGAEKQGSPVTIAATYPGTGVGSSGGILTFDPLMQLNRPGLLLNNDNVYISWASNCDNDPYHGWVIAYNKSTLQQSAVWVDTPNGTRGGIWASGTGLASDTAGNVFLASGNGTFDTSGSPIDFGDSLLKLTLGSSGLMVADYFTPYNQLTLEDNDEDLGSGGALLLPDQPGSYPHEAIGAGKQGSIYLLNRDNMGHYNPDNNSQIVQEIDGQIGGIFGLPAYWNNNVYFAGVVNTLKQFTLSNGLLSSAPVASSTVSFGFPSPTPSISSNGASDGIVWLLQTDAFRNGSNEILYGFDATNVANVLYSSNQNPVRDNPGGAVKFAVPTIANGKVYVGAAGQLSIFSVVPPEAASPVFSPAGGTYTTAQTVSLSDSTPGATIYYTTNGSIPNSSSPVYVHPIPISATTTINAIAVATGYSNSDMASGTYTITTGGGGWFNYGNGFTSTSNLVLNGAVTQQGTRLRLTDGHTGETSSVWRSTAVNVQAFTQDFTFQLTNTVADGFTFVIQTIGTSALGPGGAGLGYGAPSPGGNGGLPNSIAVKFDIYNNFGEGIDSTGLYVNGASPTTPALDMTASGVNLHSGDIFNVHMSYDGTHLAMTVTDSETFQQYGHSWTIDIPGTVGGPMAYVGFTGSSGGAGAIQDILNWTFASQGTVALIDGFATQSLVLNGKAKLNGSRLRLTDGGRGEISSAWFASPLNIQSFAQEFTFQLTQADADGLTFAIQNVGPTATGPGGAGLGYGPQSPGGNGGIRHSVAVKFDLFNNLGEGKDSTGLYVNGASPTIPATDMTSSGVSLHSGDIMDVWMTYDGTTLSMQITDLTTQATFQTSWAINIPSTVGGNTAYVGFTGGTGGGTAVQDILSWVFTSKGGAEYGNGFRSTRLALNGSSTLNGTRLRLTNGGIGQIASGWYTNPLRIQTFTQIFSFQLTNAQADGFTFTIQNNSTTEIGPGGSGLGYGAPSPGGNGGIPNSVAVKFDLYNNLGEGTDSTGLYVNGASPTIPATDMTSSGVNLHSGDVFNVRMTYDGTTLAMQVADTTTQATFQTSWPIDIPATIGSNTAYVGFTGGTGGATATQDILSWILLP